MVLLLHSGYIWKRYCRMDANCDLLDLSMVDVDFSKDKKIGKKGKKTTAEKVSWLTNNDYLSAGKGGFFIKCMDFKIRTPKQVYTKN